MTNTPEKKKLASEARVVAAGHTQTRGTESVTQTRKLVSHRPEELKCVTQARKLESHRPEELK